MSGAGKGDSYRNVNKSKYDKTLDKIFGEKPPEEYQKGKKYNSARETINKT